MGDFPFSGKTAFISGGASGIGQAIAEEFGRRGLRVVVGDIDLAGAERAAAGIDGASAVKLDVRDEASWIAALDAAEARHGPLAVLVSNAGVAGTVLPLRETPWDAWKWSREVMLDGTFLGLSHGSRRIVASGGPGHIIATASMAAIAPPPGMSVYAAMKAGVISLCEGLRQEFTNLGIGVSVLLPGAVRTKLVESNLSRAPSDVADVGNHEIFAERLRNGMDPALVAEQAADALGTDRFWLFTHPELGVRIDTRFAEIKAAMAQR